MTSILRSLRLLPERSQCRFFSRYAAREYAGLLMVEYHKSSPNVSPYRATHCKRSAFIHVRRMGCCDPVMVFPCPRSNAPVSRRGKGGRRFVVLHHEEFALAPPARQPYRDNGLQCSLIGGLGAGPPDTGPSCTPAPSPYGKIYIRAVMQRSQL